MFPPKTLIFLCTNFLKFFTHLYSLTSHHQFIVPITSFPYSPMVLSWTWLPAHNPSLLQDIYDIIKHNGNFQGLQHLNIQEYILIYICTLVGNPALRGILSFSVNLLKLEKSFGSTEFPNQGLKQIGQGVKKLSSDDWHT